MTQKFDTAASRRRLDDLERSIADLKSLLDRIVEPAAKGTAVERLSALEKDRDDALYRHIRRVKAAVDIK